MLDTKWRKSMDDLDTVAIKQARYHEFFYILESGGCFITWKPIVWIVNLAYTLILMINMLYYVPCHVMSAFHVDSLDEIGQYLNYAALILIGQTTLMAVIWYQANVIAMIALCVNGFYDYADGRKLTVEVKNLKKSVKLFKKFFKVLLPLYFLLIATSLLAGDYIDATFNIPRFYNTTYINGVYQNLPFEMYYFHTIESDLDRYFTIVSQVLCCFSLVTAISSADFVMIVFGFELIVEMKIMLTSCLDMDKRANLLYRNRFNREPPTAPSGRKCDRELMKCYEHCLRQLIEHHRIILRFSHMYKSLVNWPGGMVVLDGSITIAMSALCLAQGRIRPSIGLTSSLLLCAEVASMFVLCEIGQIIKDLSDEIFNAMYMFKWIDCCRTVQKDFIIMKHGLSKPIIIMAGSLTPLNRDAFNSIMSSAYSYLNLLLARKK